MGSDNVENEYSTVDTFNNVDEHTAKNENA